MRLRHAAGYWMMHTERTYFQRWVHVVASRKQVRAAYASAAAVWHNHLAARAINSWKFFMWIASATREAQAFRRAHLLRRCTTAWRHAVHVAQAEAQALVAADRHFLMAAARRLLRRWARRSAEKFMNRERKSAALALFRNHLEGHAFLVWKRYWRTRRAKHQSRARGDAHFVVAARRRALRRWRAWAVRHHAVISRLAHAVAYAGHQLERRVLLQWHHAAVANRAARALLRQGEQHFRAVAASRALRVWRQWATRSATTKARMRVVVRFWRGHTLRDHFSRWCASHMEARRQKALTATAVMVWKGHCLHSTFHRWRLYHRNRVFLKRQFAARTIQVGGIVVVLVGGVAGVVGGGVLMWSLGLTSCSPVMIVLCVVSCCVLSVLFCLFDHAIWTPSGPSCSGVGVPRSKVSWAAPAGTWSCCAVCCERGRMPPWVPGSAVARSTSRPTFGVKPCCGPDCGSGECGSGKRRVMRRRRRTAGL